MHPSKEQTPGGKKSIVNPINILYMLSERIRARDKKKYLKIMHFQFSINKNKAFFKLRILVILLKNSVIV